MISDMELIDAEGAHDLVTIVEIDGNLLSKNQAYRKPPIETAPNNLGGPQEVSPLRCHEHAVILFFRLAAVFPSLFFFL